HSASEAERRQLAVRFCDRVDSTILIQQLDCAVLCAVVRAYQATAAVIRLREVWKFRDGRRVHGHDKLDRRHLAVLLSTYNSHKEVLCLLSRSPAQDKSCCHRCCGTP